jgi:hypothetical protein
MVARRTTKLADRKSQRVPSRAQSPQYPDLVTAAEAVLARLRQANVVCAYGGSFALAVHGFDLDRTPNDLDLVLFDDAPPARPLRDALRAAGCTNVPPERAFQELLVAGEAKLTLRGYPLELQLPVVKAANASYHAKAAASQLILRTRASVTTVRGLPVIGPQMVAVWKAIYNREKDRRDLRTLIGITNSAGQAAITDANDLIECVRAVKGNDAVKWLNELLFTEDPWYATNS